MLEREPRIYVLPTMMTAGNILSGFVAILQIFKGREGEITEHYYWAIIAILAACLFDVLDGRVARLGGQESPFGRELDSIADDIINKFQQDMQGAMENLDRAQQAFEDLSSGRRAGASGAAAAACSAAPGAGRGCFGAGAEVSGPRGREQVGRGSAGFAALLVSWAPRGTAGPPRA